MSLGKTVSDYAQLVGLSLVLALNFTMTKVAVDSLSPFLVVSGRLAVAAILLIGFMLFARQWFPKWGPIWWPLALSAFFGHTLPFSLLGWAQQSIDAGLAAILMATMPLFTLLLAQIFTNDEKPNRYAIGGFSIALVGIVILFGPDKLASLADQSVRQYAAMCAAMSYGVNAIVTKSLTGMAWQQSSAAFMLLAFLMSLPMLLVVDFSNVSYDPTVWGAVAYSGIMSTAFAAVVIIFIIRKTSASFLSQINFMIPVFGVLFSILLINEVLPPNGALALAIILAGVALARRRPKRKIISINKGHNPMSEPIQNQNKNMPPPASAYFIAENTEVIVQHTLSVLVDNESGVLARVIGLFSGRGYNIESLTVSETEHDKHLSRITIISKGTPKVLEQIKRQLERMVPVHRVVDLTLVAREKGHDKPLERELALVKVAGTGDHRVEALRLAEAFGAQVADANVGHFVFEITGRQQKIEQFISIMTPLGLVEVCRTGIAAMNRGPEGM